MLPMLPIFQRAMQFLAGSLKFKVPSLKSEKDVVNLMDEHGRTWTTEDLVGCRSLPSACARFSSLGGMKVRGVNPALLPDNLPGSVAFRRIVSVADRDWDPPSLCCGATSRAARCQPSTAGRMPAATVPSLSVG